MRESSKLLLAGLIVFVVVLIIPKPAYSGIGTFTFRKVADTNTPIPGGTGNFIIFEAPSIDGGSVAFRASGTAGQSGIYLDTGVSLVLIADESTPIPGGTGNFTGFSSVRSLSFGGVNVAFVGNGSSGQEGIYIGAGGPLEVVADLNTPIPGGTGSFTGFGNPSISGDNVAFIGAGSTSQSGIYLDTGGSLVLIADKSTPIPGGTGDFTIFQAISLDGGSVAFLGGGSTSQRGIYLDTGGSLVLIADKSTPIPGGTGTFTAFGFDHSLDGGSVAFFGIDLFDVPNPRGIYIGAGGPLEVVADLSTPIPGGTGNFEGFGSVSKDGDNVAFEGDDGSEEGIFIDIGGVLMKVINPGDTLDGKTVSSFISFSKEGLSGNSIAFLAGFTDFSEGIFVAELVSPPDNGDDDMGDGGFDPADANEDGMVTSADITCTILGIFGMSCPMPDCNEDGSATSADITCVILEIFNQ